MTKDYAKIREIELFYIREIARLKRLKKEKIPVTNSSDLLVTGLFSLFFQFFNLAIYLENNLFFSYFRPIYCHGVIIFPVNAL